MDNLEKYIRDHRSEFDDKLPSDRLWKKIDSGLDSGGRQVFIKNHIWKAAVVVLMVSVIGLLIDRQSKIDQINLNQIETTEGIALKDVEEYYYRLIENKQQQIENYIQAHPEVNEELITDLDKLDSSYVELKKKLVKGPDERIMDAMVVNLQMRIEILNQQLNVLERIKHIKDKEDETKNI